MPVVLHLMSLVDLLFSLKTAITFISCLYALKLLIGWVHCIFQVIEYVADLLRQHKQAMQSITIRDLLRSGGMLRNVQHLQILLVKVIKQNNGISVCFALFLSLFSN